MTMLTARTTNGLVCIMLMTFTVCLASTAPRKLLETQSYGGGWEADLGGLDLLSTTLQSEPDSTGYIFVYGARRGYHNDVAKRIKCYKGYLLQRRGISPEHLKVLNGGYREHVTIEVWVAPNGSVTPVPTPTIKPGMLRSKRGGTRYSCSL
jgi:hypothetical protein